MITRPAVRSAATLLLLIVITTVPAAAAPAPRLHSFLKAARLVVAGEVTAVTSYDEDRISVAVFGVERTLKGNPPSGPLATVSIVELHEGSNRPGLAVGERGIAFLQPAARSSYVANVLPPGTYYELLPEFGSFLVATSKADAERQTAIVARLASAARGKGMDAGAARQLTFDLLACENRLLVEDAIPGLTDLAKPPELAADELSTLRAALQRTTLPERVRIALIDAVATAGIRQAVPVLQGIDSPPPIAEAAWRALDRLGAPPPEKSLETLLADPKPEVRAAAVRELLRRDGIAAVSQVAPVAVQDSDPTVRREAVDALGALGKPEALPPLERVFADSPTELQQASGRAILAVGGPPAADAFGRLAFAGPLQSQRYAVLLLMLMTEPHKDEVLQRIAKTHSDAEIRNLIEHGLDVHDH